MSDEIDLLPGWRRALRMFEADGLRSGDVVSDAWLDLHLGVERPELGSAADFRRIELRRFQQFKRFEEELLEQHQLALRRNADVEGYEVLSAAEQLQHATSEGVRRLRAAFRWTTRVLANTNTEALTDAQRAQHADAMAKLSRLRSMAQRETRALAAPSSRDKDPEDGSAK